MHRTILITVLVNLIFAITPLSRCPASDVRVKSLGQMYLLIEDQDNQLNLYDFGRNPAWLRVDQQRSWLRPFFTTDMNRGNFRRAYDPGEFIDFHAMVEGIKVMDKNQTFRGLVDYHDLNLKNVYQAITRDVYLEHPFRLADNSAGNTHYWGPAISSEYSRNVYAQKLFIGAALIYQIETGLKDFYPQPRTIYRYLASGTGMAYRVSNRLSLGSTINYSATQEFTECISTSMNDPRPILITRFRGEKIGSERLGNMERFAMTKTVEWGMQSHFQAANDIGMVLSFYYNIQDFAVTERYFQSKKDGTWKLKGYEIHWLSRFKFPNQPFRFGLSCDRIYFNDWAIHPDFEVLLGDDHFIENRVGVGIAFEPVSLPFMLGIEYHVGLAQKDKKDYVSRMNGSGAMDGNELRIGAELRLLEKWQVRAGFIFQQNRIDSTLLAFSEFQPEHDGGTVTWGLAYTIQSAEFEIYGYYGKQRPTGILSHLEREQSGIIFSMKFYQD